MVFDSRVDHLYDSGICLIGSPAGLGNGLSILGNLCGLSARFRSFLENYLAGHLAFSRWVSRLSLPLSFRRGASFSAPASRDANLSDEPYFSLVKSF